MKVKLAKNQIRFARKFAGCTLSILRKEFKDVIEYLAPTAKKMLVYCSAKLINILMRWGNYRMARYPEPRNEWIYLTQEDFCRELLEEHSIHCIRDSLNLLEKIKLVDITRNWKWLNNRNGQTRTYQYRLNRQLLKQTITTVKQRQLQQQEEAESLIYSQIGKFAHANCKSTYPSFNPADPRFTVEEYTQIPYTETSSKTSSHKGASAEFSQIDELEEDVAKEEYVSQYIVTTEDIEYVSIDEENEKKEKPSLKQQTSHEGQSSAALGGFTSRKERDNFYKEVIEFAKHKSGVHSPVSWTGTLMKSIAKGEPCIYLDEFRRGEKVGTCEQREWEIAPGRPYDNFVSYLIRKFQTIYNTVEQATQAVYKALADINQARTLWNGYLLHLVNLEQEWEKQSALGVSTPYIPPEVLPQKQVSVERAAAAIANLVQASTVNAICASQQRFAIAPEETVTEQPAVALEETVSEEPAVAPEETAPEETVSEEPIIAPEETDTEDKRRQKIIALIPSRNIMLRYPMGINFVKVWVEENSDLVKFNEEGQVVAIDTEENVTVTAESGTQGTDEISKPTDGSCIKVGDYVFVNSCPHTDKFGPFEVLEIDGEFAQIEMFPHPVRLSELRIE